MKVYVSKRAEKELHALPMHVRKRFVQALDRLETAGLHTVDARPIEGTAATWRLGVGTYRAIFEVD